MRANRSEVLRRLIGDGLAKWRKEWALERLEDHEITLRKAAEFADVEYVEILSLANEAGIEVGYTSEDLDRDLERV